MGTLQSGFGLNGMRRGAEAMGGGIVLSSLPGEGFEIRVELPAEGAANAANTEDTKNTENTEKEKERGRKTERGGEKA